MLLLLKLVLNVVREDLCPNDVNLEREQLSFLLNFLALTDDDILCVVSVTDGVICLELLLLAVFPFNCKLDIVSISTDGVFIIVSVGVCEIPDNL